MKVRGFQSLPPKKSFQWFGSIDKCLQINPKPKFLLIFYYLTN